MPEVSHTFGTGGIWMPQVFRRCPGIVPSGMLALKFGVGAIILDRDREASISTKRIDAMCLPVFQVGTDWFHNYLFQSFVPDG